MYKPADLEDRLIDFGNNLADCSTPKGVTKGFEQLVLRSETSQSSKGNRGNGALFALDPLFPDCSYCLAASFGFGRGGSWPVCR